MAHNTVKRAQRIGKPPPDRSLQYRCNARGDQRLVDTPWPLTLAQVAFLVLFGMVLGVYFFFVKGWLR
jgi:hypothetical protein